MRVTRRSIDGNHDGLLTADDFRKAFFVEGDEEDILAAANKIADGGAVEEISIPQFQIAELKQASKNGEI